MANEEFLQRLAFLEQELVRIRRNVHISFSMVHQDVYNLSIANNKLSEELSKMKRIIKPENEVSGNSGGNSKPENEVSGNAGGSSLAIGAEVGGSTTTKLSGKSKAAIGAEVEEGSTTRAPTEVCKSHVSGRGCLKGENCDHPRVMLKEINLPEDPFHQNS